jgi:2-polyprenyl-6-methoxyphenol hydroxylase-like FAD-dependent oxidoreductase
LIENTLLTYLKTKNNLRILEGACIKELILAENQTQIAKVYFHYQDQTSELDVDLFVDASGRDSTSPLWLESFCGEKVPFTNKGSHVGYATQVYRLDIPSKHPDWKLLSLYDMDSPGVRCGGALFIENKQVMVLATGANQDYPSNEEKSFKDFLFSIPGSEQLYPIFDAGTPVSSVKGFRRTENRLFHFDKVSSLPKNFFIIGDAVCVFNPSYGQGMTTALAAASLLNRFLITNTPLDSRKFQKALAKILSFPWISATVSDLLYSRAAKEKMSVSDYLKSEALYYLIKSTNYDSRLTKSFVEVLHMVKPVQILFSPHYIPAFARALSSPK